MKVVSALDKFKELQVEVELMKQLLEESKRENLEGHEEDEKRKVEKVEKRKPHQPKV